jgi:hypothetical protein
MLFEFVLFAILGWCVFSPPPQKLIPMIVFVVLMVLWVLAGVTGYAIPWPHR